jgi:hypothetical protein
MKNILESISKLSIKDEIVFFKEIDNQPELFNDYLSLLKSCSEQELNDFYAKRQFNVYTNFTREKTLGFYGECNLTFNNLMICLTNTNVKQGLKVIVEVVAYGDF